MKMMIKKKTKIVIWSFAVFILINIGIFSAIPFIVMNPMVEKHVDFNHIWKPSEFGLDATHFFVQTEDGLTISAYEVAVDTPKVVVICLSGIHNPSVTAYFGHAKLFKENSFSTILFDMRAHGESTGNKVCLGYMEYLDTKAIVEYIKQQSRYTGIPIVIMGVSMGGATAINSIGKIPEIDGLISISAYSSWEEVFYENMQKSTPKIIAKIEYPFVCLTTFIKYGRNISIKPKAEIKKLGNRPALLMHSKQDSQIPFSNFEKLLESASSHVETFIREGDLHFMTENFTEPYKDKEYSEKLLDFMKRIFTEHDLMHAPN